MSLPRRKWFRMQPPSDLHGVGHISRVMVWASVLATDTEWFDRVMWAAACHDLRREDDGNDPDHGFRAGRFVRTVLPKLLKQPMAGIEEIASACDWHVCRDDDSEWDHPVLWLLKDADGLDRVRLYDLDERYLRSDLARELVPRAKRLLERTEFEDDAGRIWERAEQVGVPMEKLREFVARAEGLLSE